MLYLRCGTQSIDGLRLTLTLCNLFLGIWQKYRQLHFYDSDMYYIIVSINMYLASGM